MERSAVFIAHKEYSPREPPVASNAPPLILLHGMTNAKETWDNCAQVIADRTGTTVYCLDARNHGDSDWDDTIGYEVMAEDVAHFMDGQKLEKVTIVGHSMGGKTGMSFALKYPHRLESLIVEDISLRGSSVSRTGVDYYLQQLRNVIRKIAPETELDEAKRQIASLLTGGETAAKKKENENVISPRSWDGKDLPLKRNTSGDFEWKTNLRVITETLDSGKWTPVTSVGVYLGPVLIIYGTKSPFKVLDDRVAFLKQFPSTRYEPIQDGSHNLHVEYPEIFTNLVCDFILQKRA